MLTGELIGGALLVSPDGTGKPIVENAAPEAPEGYEMEPSWRDDGERIVRAWEAVPREGTALDAAVRLCRMLARDLTDEQAKQVAALYGEWRVGAYYDKADRARDAGDLYRCTEAHTALAEWRPSRDSGHWVKL